MFIRTDICIFTYFHIGILHIDFVIPEIMETIFRVHIIQPFRQGGTFIQPSILSTKI
jgi:hypothetical protein